MEKEKPIKQWTKVIIPQTGEEAFHNMLVKEPLMPVEDGYGWYGVYVQNEDGTKGQCHRCGKMMGNLTRHIMAKHGYASIIDYKNSLGFLIKARLIPEKLRLLRIQNTLRLREQGRFLGGGSWDKEKATKMANLPRKPRRNNAQQTNEFKNAIGTCDLQLLDRLIVLSNKLGKPNISWNDLVNNGEASLGQNLGNRFGTFNYAKKLVGLVVNPCPREVIVPKKLILEGICIFFERYGRNPTQSDYNKRLLPFTRKNVMRQFTTCNDALIAAGLSPNSKGGFNGGKRLSYAKV